MIMRPVLLAPFLLLAAASAPAPTAVAVFASGCFWSTESGFDKVPGVISTTSGFTGGRVANPSYEAVSGGRTGHYEAVRVVYDPSRISYAKLVDAYWRTIDPGDAGGTFCDRGSEYRTAIFPLNAGQRAEAAASKARLNASGILKRAVATAILNPAPFYPAEAYHQDYHTKNPVKYELYRQGCGRPAALRAVWGKQAG